MASDSPRLGSIARAGDTLTRLGGAYLRWAWPWAPLVMVLAAILKNGVGVEADNVAASYLPASQALPTPIGYYSSSFGDLLLAKLLGVTTVGGFVALHVVLVAVAVVVSVLMVRRFPGVMRNYLLLILVTSAAFGSLFVTIGKYDVVTFLGASTLALSRTWRGSAAGAVLMACGNPEQAAVATGAFVLLTAAPHFAAWRSRALAAFAGAVAVLLGTQAWFLLNGQFGTRLAEIKVWLVESIYLFLSNPSVAIWSWFGAGWLVMLAILIAYRGRDRWLVVLTALAIPAFVTIITRDGTRVFGLVSLPVYLACAQSLLAQESERSRATRLLVGLILVLLVITPANMYGWPWLLNQVWGWQPSP